MKKHAIKTRIVDYELVRRGYKVVRIRGSHHMYKNQEGKSFVIPYHGLGANVKACYIRDIEKKTGICF